MPFDVRPIDLNDDALLHRQYDVFVEGRLAGRPDAAILPYDRVAARLREPDSYRRLEQFAAFEPGTDTMVGAGQIALTLQENRDQLDFDLGVPARLRGRGIGAALFDHVLARARAEGRSSLLTELNLLPGKENDDPGVGFLTRRGLTLRNTEIRRQLRLPVAAERLEALAGKASESSSPSAYRLVGWSGPTPEEYAAECARLKGMIVDEAPSGDLERESVTWDVARLREFEANKQAAGLTLSTVVAVAPDGRLAAHSRAAVHGDRAQQGDTLVVPEHRGNRLGLAVKVANLQRLQAEHPGASRIDTANAEQNGPMVHINDQLGFVPIEILQDWQGSIA